MAAKLPAYAEAHYRESTVSVTFAEAFSVSDAFSRGWTALRASPLALLSGAFALNLLDLLGGGGGGGGGGSGADESAFLPAASGFFDGLSLPALAGLLGVALVVILAVVAVVMVIEAFVRAGWVRSHREVLVTGETKIDTLFSGFDRLWPLLLARLLMSLGWIAVASVALLPALPLYLAAGEAAGAGVFGLVFLGGGVWYGLGTLFIDHAVVLEERGPVEGVRRSFELAVGHRLPLGIYVLASIVAMLASLLGLLLLCVGVFATTAAARAVVDVGLTRGFLLVTQGREALSSG